MTRKHRSGEDREPGLPYAPKDILAALAVAPLSIDVVAERLGARSVREVRALGMALRELAEAGRVAAVGNGTWSIPGAEAAPAPPVTASDVLLFGFGDGAGPLSFARIRANLSRDTGRDTARLHEILSALLATGKVALSGQRSFVLTPLGLGEASEQSGEGPETSLLLVQMGPAERRALFLMSAPVSQMELARALGVTRERARQLIFRLIDRGHVEAVDAGPGRLDAKRLYRAAQATQKAA